MHRGDRVAGTRLCRCPTDGGTAPAPKPAPAQCSVRVQSLGVCAGAGGGATEPAHVRAHVRACVRACVRAARGIRGWLGAAGARRGVWGWPGLAAPAARRADTAAPQARSRRLSRQPARHATAASCSARAAVTGSRARAQPPLRPKPRHAAVGQRTCGERERAVSWRPHLGARLLARLPGGARSARVRGAAALPPPARHDSAGARREHSGKEGQRHTAVAVAAAACSPRPRRVWHVAHARWAALARHLTATGTVAFELLGSIAPAASAQPRTFKRRSSLSPSLAPPSRPRRRPWPPRTSPPPSPFPSSSLSCTTYPDHVWNDS